MGRYITRLEKIFANLNRQAPFSKSEKSELSKRDRVFIRNLQIKDKSSKEEAIEKYKQSILKGPEEYKKLQKDTTSFVKELYPVHDKKISTEVEPKRTGQKVIRLKAAEFNKHLEKIAPNRRAKFIAAHKKYPDATWYELDVGVNSKKSQQYRIKHSRPEQYEGRIYK
jgi:hypothetical protein